MSREWCYTHNNPTDVDLRRFKKLRPGHTIGVTYHVFQIEQAKSGTCHFQGYIIFDARKRFETVKKLFKEQLDARPHLESRLKTSTPAAAAAYCKDPNKRHPQHTAFLFEKGAIPDNLAPGQGARTDLLAIRDAIRSGRSPAALLDDDQFFPTVLRLWKNFDRLHTITQQGRCAGSRRAPAVLALFGQSRCGKSDVLTRLPNREQYFYLPVGSSGTLWFNEYDPAVHTTLVINEFHGSMLPCGEFLRFFDGTPLTVNTKGGQVPFLFKKIIITANAHPKQWYNFFLPDGVTPNPEGPRHPYDALWLRLQCVFEYIKKDDYALTQRDKQDLQDGRFTPYSFAVCRRGSANFHPDVAKGVYRRLSDWNGDAVFAVPEMLQADSREENSTWWD